MAEVTLPYSTDHKWSMREKCEFLLTLKPGDYFYWPAPQNETSRTFRYAAEQLGLLCSTKKGERFTRVEISK